MINDKLFQALVDGEGNFIEVMKAVINVEELVSNYQ